MSDWHQAVLNACMSIECAYAEADPARTLHELISWHRQDATDIANAVFEPEQSSDWHEAQAVPTLLDWAVSRWRAEVERRPLVNIHRRTLDSTWRQVIRFAGGRPDDLIGHDHDTLVAQRI